MSSNKPTVFVSSTCYDLKQIRKDLERFLIDELGYEALLSESDSFPVDPQLNTIDNCTRNVDELADIFVLIIGCRYGMITDSGKSITNLEYLHASRKNIPIYVFIDKSIISNIPIWKENPAGSFSSIVDTPKLFEFADSLRSLEGIWCFPYEQASDIVTTLRSQLAYLFREGLKVRSLLKQSKLTGNLRNLSGESLNIFLTKPSGWEFRLFSAVLNDGFEDASTKRRNLEYGIIFTDYRNITSTLALIDYIICQLKKLSALASNLTILFDDVQKIAFGTADNQADADLIIYTARSIIDVYNAFIDWSFKGYEILPTSEQEEIVKCIPEVCKPTINDIENFIGKCSEYVRDIMDKTNNESSKEYMNVNLTFSIPNTAPLQDAVDNYRVKLATSNQV